jgi:outer membrane biosynthesis protein TonB
LRSSQQPEEGTTVKTILALLAAALAATAMAQPAKPAAEAPKPAAEAPKSAAQESKPAPKSARKATSRRHLDARHCLEKPTNEEIIKCAEAYL